MFGDTYVREPRFCLFIINRIKTRPQEVVKVQAVEVPLFNITVTCKYCIIIRHANYETKIEQIEDEMKVRL